MLIGNNSKYLLKKTQAKSKMFEYDVPLEEHIKVESNAIEILLIAVGVIGNMSKKLWESESTLIVSNDDKKELEFSSRFFDALFQSRLELSHQKYYLLLGSISYYFSDMIGSSMVLARGLDFADDFESSGIAFVIQYLLSGNNNPLDFSILEGRYRDGLSELVNDYDSFLNKNINVNFKKFEKLKKQVYAEGTNRELLLIDALLAIFKKKILNSALYLMPIFSDTTQEKWHEQLIYQRGLKELWPAQINFGTSGVFNGASGVIQMPTSSGKTTSIALTIQTAFLAQRTNLSVIIAPFRALCKEISDDLEKYFKQDSNFVLTQLSDIPDSDELFEAIDLYEGNMQIVILTPEKFLYLLRNDRTILEKMGLVIFDEAHLFDEASRGANYELLLSTIKLYLEEAKRDVQKLLISAVIPNSAELNSWFNGNNGVVISDNTIKSSEKTIAFSDWIGKENSSTGVLHFVNPENINEEEFFVPRVVEVSRLKRKHRERKDRFFPEYEKTSDLGIYYALKLNHNGGIAIFCATKISANNILKRFLDINERGYDISSLSRNCKDNENEKMARLVEVNYGIENNIYKAVREGVFVHHAGISNGIRNAVEYAIKNNLSKCVVCTSTLAQGVNLPIKYLIVSSIYQAREEIKVRDFHNLIGRTGRAGKYTEGSIIFSESNIYSRRNQPKERWKFDRYSRLLDTSNSEKCSSNLLKIVQEVTFREGNINYSIPFKSLLEVRYANKDNYSRILKNWRKTLQNYQYGLATFEENLFIFENSLEAIENYILDFQSLSLDEEYNIEKILSQTLGYHLASDEEKVELANLFEIIQKYVKSNISEKNISSFSKAQLGVFKAENLREWVVENSGLLISAKNELEVIILIMPQLIFYSENKILKNIIQQDELTKIAQKWIEGESYYNILQYCNWNNLSIKDNRRQKSKQRELALEDIIDICDNGFGYSAIMVVNAIAEFISDIFPENTDIEEVFNCLGKKLRYGLFNKKEILVYELGFSDRILSQRIAEIISPYKVEKLSVKSSIKENKSSIAKILVDFPTYFNYMLSNM